MSDIENRLIELEIKNAHQEDTIEQLNQIVITQQASIDELIRHIKRLKNQLTNLQENNSKEQAESPPPHY
jgi:SlyX protein